MLRAASGTRTQVKFPQCSCRPNKAGECCKGARCGCRKAGAACSAKCKCQSAVTSDTILCLTHGAPTKRLVVNKPDSINHGRAFYKCTLRTPCGFFRWADDGDDGGHLGCLNMGAGAGVVSKPRPKSRSAAPRPTITGKQRIGGRKACELGASCPFQHEHQHTAEYHHQGQTVTKPTVQAFSGKGHKLGHGPRAPAAAAQATGHRLGGATSVALDANTSFTGGAFGGAEKREICSYCDKSIPRSTFPAHIADHESQFAS